MKILISLGLILFALSLKAQEQSSAQELFKKYKIDPAEVTYSTETYAWSACPEVAQVYFVDMMFPIKTEAEPTVLRLAMQTISKKSQQKLAQALNENFQSKGLPPCLEKDLFSQSSTGPDGHKWTFQPEYQETSYQCMGYPVSLPLTHCSDVDPIYP